MNLAEIEERAKQRRDEMITGRAGMVEKIDALYAGLCKFSEEELLQHGINKELYHAEKLFPSLWAAIPNSEKYIEERDAALVEMEKIRLFKLELMKEAEELLK